MFAALPALAEGAIHVGTIASGVMAANDAINKTKDTIDNWNNTSTEDTPVGGFKSSTQGSKIPPSFLRA